MLPLLIILSLAAISLCKVQATAQESSNNIVYQQVQTTKPCPAVIHILTLDPTNVTIELVKANNRCKGLAKTSTLTKEHIATAGINGGFYHANGTPSGICKIGTTWYTTQKLPRAALGWKKDGSAWLIDIIDTKSIITIDNRQFPVNAFNQTRNPHEAVVYTPAFDVTTGTNDEGSELIIENNIITHIVIGHGNNTIPENGFIYSIGKDAPFPLESIHSGMPANFQTHILPRNTSAEKWDSMDFIVGGTPLLIFNGKRIEDFSSEKTLQKFLDEKCARTAIGITHNNQIIFVAVEHINTTENNGMTMQELALLMEELNCIYALNLSGGHSSTLVVEQLMRNNPHGEISFGGIINWEKEVSTTLTVKNK